MLLRRFLQYSTVETMTNIPTWKLREMYWEENLDAFKRIWSQFTRVVEFSMENLKATTSGALSFGDFLWGEKNPNTITCSTPSHGTGLSMICGARILLSKMLTLLPAFLIHLWRTDFWPSHNICKCHNPGQEFYWGHLQQHGGFAERYIPLYILLAVSFILLFSLSSLQPFIGNIGNTPVLWGFVFLFLIDTYTQFEEQTAQKVISGSI